VAAEETASPSPEVKVYRMRPVDEHDRQKNLRLVGMAEGAPKEVWKTVTQDIASIVSGAVSLEAIVAKLKADAAEYYGRYAGLDSIEAQLKALGIEDI
jgi:hypothetical protein